MTRNVRRNDMLKKAFIIFCIALTIVFLTTTISAAAENLAPQASSVVASSEFSDDFHAAGVIDGIIPSLGVASEWAALFEVEEAWLQLDFASDITAGSIHIYQRGNSETIVSATLDFSNGTSLELSDFPEFPASQTTPKIVVLDPALTFRWVRITINEGSETAQNIGISSFEIYASNDGTGENLALGSTVTASSYFNDNYAPERAINGIRTVPRVSGGGVEWASLGDPTPYITLTWDSPITADTIHLYCRNNRETVLGGRIIFDGDAGTAIEYGAVPFEVGMPATPLIITFPERTFSSMTVHIDESEGNNLGFGEIEVYHMAGAQEAVYETEAEAIAPTEAQQEVSPESTAPTSAPATNDRLVMVLVVAFVAMILFYIASKKIKTPRAN